MRASLSQRQVAVLVTGLCVVTAGALSLRAGDESATEQAGAATEPTGTLTVVWWTESVPGASTTARQDRERLRRLDVG